MVNSASITEAYIKYEDDNLAVMAGRQAIDLEWLGDYNDGVVGIIKAVPDTEITLAYSNRQAEIGIDVVEDFSTKNDFDISGNNEIKSVFAIDAKYAGVEGLEVNPYYFALEDTTDIYGMKVSYDTDMFGATAHYAKSNEDTNKYGTTEDGDILALEGRFNIIDIALAAGYIKTDKNIGVGNMAQMGDNISPFDEGANTYSADAKTYYGSIGYEIAGVGLTALYGQTKYDNSGVKDKENEFNFIVDYSFTDELSANLTYVDYNDKSTANGDFDKVYANLTYAF
jgi:hypothetical protein